ncbi:TPA: tetratricopeptide repeat protein [Thermoplasmata archaeon]|nr:tetratricopeptide repeat protein [Thermoplasmata archaeon]
MTEIAQVGTSDAPDADSDIFTRANEAYDDGEYDLAIRLLDEGISQNPGSVVAFNNKGAALDALGHKKEAEGCYRAAIALSSRYELAWHNLRNCLFGQERFKEAYKAYSRAESLKPSRVENLLGLAESAIELGWTRRARGTIRRLSEAAKRDHSLLLIQADMFVLVGEGDDAVERCERFISMHPGDVAGHLHLGGVRHELGKYVEAIPSFEHALRLSPDDAQIWNNLGYTCFCAGNVERALSTFDRALELDPGYKHAWYNKGYALHGVDRLEEAVECYRRAVEIDDRDRVLLNNLGNALYNLGRYAESIPMFVEAICIDPDYEIAWNNIGNALERMGLFEEAIPFHDRALEIRPDFDYALYAKGVCKGAVGEPEEGYDLILESLDLNPTYDEAWKARAKVAAMLGRFDDALSSVDRSVMLNPGLCDGWLDRGDILLDLGDGSGAEESYLETLRCLDRMAVEYENDGEPWAMRARVLARLARHEEALDAAVRAATALHPDRSALPMALELCRAADIRDPPGVLISLAGKDQDPRTAIALAGFLAHVDAMGEARGSLTLIRADELTPEGRALLVRANVALGEQDAASAVVESSVGEERELLRAEFLVASGALAQATEHLEQVLSTNPGNHRLALALARAYMASDRPRDALRMAEAVSGLDGRDWEALEVKAAACDSLGLDARARRARARAAQLLARCGERGEGEQPRGGA